MVENINSEWRIEIFIKDPHIWISLPIKSFYDLITENNEEKNKKEKISLSDISQFRISNIKNKKNLLKEEIDSYVEFKTYLNCEVKYKNKSFDVNFTDFQKDKKEVWLIGKVLKFNYEDKSIVLENNNRIFSLESFEDIRPIIEIEKEEDSEELFLEVVNKIDKEIYELFKKFSEENQNILSDNLAFDYIEENNTFLCVSTNLQLTFIKEYLNLKSNDYFPWKNFEKEKNEEINTLTHLRDELGTYNKRIFYFNSDFKESIEKEMQNVKETIKYFILKIDDMNLDESEKHFEYALILYGQNENDIEICYRKIEFIQQVMSPFSI